MPDVPNFSLPSVHIDLMMYYFFLSVDELKAFVIKGSNVDLLMLIEVT
jgi:hypothetical protein